MDKIIEVSMKGRADRSAGLVPPGVPGNNSSLKPAPFDPTQAKQLIAQSKYGSADKLPAITMYVYGAAGPVTEAAVAMWKQNLGIDVKVEAIKELKEYMDRKHNRDFPIFFSGWRADYLDPQNFLDVLFQTGSDENFFAYSNPDVDAALKAAAVERDESVRLKKYQDIEKMILADSPAVPFYCSVKTYMLAKPYVNGLKLFPIAINHWNEVSVAAH